MKDLVIHERPEVGNPPLVLGFTGWMDGGRVSTGTVGYLQDRLGATTFAEINPLDFYIFNFPVPTLPISVYSDSGKAVVASVNPMEFAAVFRPHTKIENGTIKELVYPQNEFSYSKDADLALLFGEEPHIRWGAYCDCVFGLAHELGIKEFYFVGSVASPLPHTREPRIRASVPGEHLKPALKRVGTDFGDYEGPSSIVTSLAHHAGDRGIEMRVLVVEVPHYPFLDMPAYPRSILKTTSTLSKLLRLDLDLSDLRESADAAEEKLNAVMEENEDFRELVKQLEDDYDQEEPSGDEQRLRRLVDSIDLEGDGSNN